jgi:RNA polymerase sigma-70 factor (ECF subfamily)
VEWLTTSTILQGLRDYGNHAAWQRLAERFQRPIVAFVRRMGLSAADADDVAQETLIAFAQALRNGQYDRNAGRLSRYLFGIAYRQALGARRAIGRRTPPAVSSNTDPLSQIPDEQTASVAWDREWEQTLLQQCIEQVGREVELVTLRAFELVVRQERSPADAAAELGVPIKLIYNAKHRVLKRIRELRKAFDEVE